MNCRSAALGSGEAVMEENSYLFTTVLAGPADHQKL